MVSSDASQHRRAEQRQDMESLGRRVWAGQREKDRSEGRGMGTANKGRNPEENREGLWKSKREIKGGKTYWGKCVEEWRKRNPATKKAAGRGSEPRTQQVLRAGPGSDWRVSGV